jgi:hypothetical protein
MSRLQRIGALEGPFLSESRALRDGLPKGMLAPMLEEARLETEALRTSHEPQYQRLRQLLVERGLDPQQLVLSEFFNDERKLMFGVLVAPDRRIWTFYVDELDSDAGDQTQRAARLYAWTDLTDSWENSGYEQGVKDGLQVLAEGL